MTEVLETIVPVKRTRKPAAPKVEIDYKAENKILQAQCTQLDSAVRSNFEQIRELRQAADENYQLYLKEKEKLDYLRNQLVMLQKSMTLMERR